MNNNNNNNKTRFNRSKRVQELIDRDCTKGRKIIIRKTTGIDVRGDSKKKVK
jgi:hypothetical protein